MTPFQSSSELLSTLGRVDACSALAAEVEESVEGSEEGAERWVGFASWPAGAGAGASSSSGAGAGAGGGGGG